jgi:ABC-type transport system involved in multi-copper enzyme maturation permease subunit
MKALLWKEWRELRSAGPLSALFAFLIVILLAVYDFQYGQHNIRAHGRMDVSLLLSGIEIMIPAVPVLGAILIGAGLIAPEVGSGSLSFLTSLPMSRRKIWSSKLLAGICAIVCSLTGAAAGGLVGIVLLRLVAKVHIGWTELPDHGTVLLYAATLIGGFSVGLMVSALFDRTVGAATAGIFLAVGLFALLAAQYQIALAAGGVNGPKVATLSVGAVLLAITGTLLRGSYRAFTRGETLKTGWRFVEAALGITEVLWWLLLFPIVAFLWFIW